jgi:hypothetical protein
MYLGRPLALLVPVALGALFLAPRAEARALTGSVVVVHGLRGVVADVYVDGQLALPTFQPERTTDPITLPVGNHQVEIRPAGAAPTSPPAVAAAIDVQAGVRESVVAHLDASGQPEITTFADPVDAVPSGQARVVIRDVAQAPALDVTFDGAVVASGLNSPAESATLVAPGAHQVAVNSAGTANALTAPSPVTLEEGTATVMYLVGSAQSSTLTWLGQQVTGLATPPNLVQTGDSGLAAEGGASQPWALFGGVPLVVALAAAAMTAMHQRRRREAPGASRTAA